MAGQTPCRCSRLNWSAFIGRGLLKRAGGRFAQVCRCENARVIRIAVGQLRGTDERDLLYAAQLGVHGLQLFPPDPDPARHWTVEALQAARAACEAYGLVL